MLGNRYEQRRGQIEAYFDRTAMRAWEQLTSQAPVSRVRATVREGRDRMRGTLLSWLPQDLRGARILDAGCGTGAFAMEAARRGAEVLAIDLSPSLVDVAMRRVAEHLDVFAHGGRIDFRAGDFTAPELGRFDYVVAMDSLIHYTAEDALGVLRGWAQRTDRALIFTFAPSSPLLRTMHVVGKLFPRGDRAPAIVPVAEQALRRMLAAHDGFSQWQTGRTQRIGHGFYTSQAFEIVATAATQPARAEPAASLG